MPFKSKAQQRYMFATDPEKAKEWAKETKDIKGLPEKKHPSVNPEKKDLPPMEEKKASVGMFFEKRSQPIEGNFFRDMRGRDDANFAKEAFSSYAAGQIPRGGGINVSPAGSMYGTGGGNPAAPGDTSSTTTQKVDAGVTGAPVGGLGQRGEGMGGGMYGSGEGTDSADDSPEARLKAMLGEAVAEGPGGESSKEKTAGKSPSDWDAESGIPTGFHRPAYEQPEGLESGGERFHSTEAKGADYGAGSGLSHGLVEGGKLRMKGSSGSQIGKHASATPRFLGTSRGVDKTAGAGEYWRERGSEALSSAKGGVEQLGRSADEGVRAITKSPAASLIATALLARYGLGKARAGARAIGRGAKKLRKKTPAVSAKPPSLAERFGQGAKRSLKSLGITE